MAALVAFFIVLIIPGILFLVAVIGAEVGLHAVFSNASSAAAAIGVLLDVSIGVVAFAIALLVGSAVGGPVGTAIRQYALLFYGSRYSRWQPALAASNTWSERAGNCLSAGSVLPSHGVLATTECDPFSRHS